MQPENTFAGTFFLDVVCASLVLTRAVRRFRARLSRHVPMARLAF